MLIMEIFRIEKKLNTPPSPEEIIVDFCQIFRLNIN